MQGKENSQGRCNFLQCPSLNLGANDYMDLINFKEEDITEPPITAHLSNEELMAYVQREKFPQLEIPCHSQNIDRVVADMTIAAQTRVGHMKSHENLVMTFQSREQVPTNARKTDFKMT